MKKLVVFEDLVVEVNDGFEDLMVEVNNGYEDLMVRETGRF